jgi:hypothetical protein
VPELVEFQAGVVVQQDVAAVIAEADPAGVRADVAGRWPAGRDGLRRTGTAVRSYEKCRRAGAASAGAGGRCRCPSTPIGSRRLWDRMGAWRLSRSRSCTSISRISAARAAVSYSIRRRVFSRSGMSRRDSSRWTAVLGTALVSPEFPGGVRSRRGPRGGPVFLGLVPGEPGAEDCTDRQARPRRSTPACIWTAWS